MTQVIDELTLDQMAELFQRNKSTISRHIKNIFETGELNKEMFLQKTQQLLRMLFISWLHSVSQSVRHHVSLKVDD